MQSENAKFLVFSKMYSPGDAAKILSISTRAMLRLIRTGAIEYVEIFPGRCDFARIKGSVLQKWIDEHSVKPVVRESKKKPEHIEYVPLKQLLREGAFQNERRSSKN